MDLNGIIFEEVGISQQQIGLLNTLVFISLYIKPFHVV